MARRRKSGLYHFFIVLPDRLYPFSTTIRGRRVRGRRAYEYKIAQFERQYGPGHLGVLINCYRSLFHVIGSILLIVATAWVSQHFLGNEIAIKLLLGVAVFLVSYQEFYYHRRHYQQIFRKSVLDWLSWVVPIGLYLFYFGG